VPKGTGGECHGALSFTRWLLLFLRALAKEPGQGAAVPLEHATLEKSRDHLGIAIAAFWGAGQGRKGGKWSTTQQGL